MATGASFENPSFSISLLSILKALKRGITEDEAWAIAYQAVVSAEECLEKGTLLTAVEEPSQLWLNCGGDVDAKSFNAILCDNPDETRRLITEMDQDEMKVTSGLRDTLLIALKYGRVEDDAEPFISDELLWLFKAMTSVDEVDGKLRPFLNVPVVPLGGNENATLNATKPFLYVKIICEGNQMRDQMRKYPGLQTLMSINNIHSTAGKFYRDQCAHLAVEAIQKFLDELANVSSGFPTTAIIQLSTKELTTATTPCQDCNCPSCSTLAKCPSCPTLCKICPLCRTSVLPRKNVHFFPYCHHWCCMSCGRIYCNCPTCVCSSSSPI